MSRVVVWFIAVWAVVASAVAWWGLPQVNADARMLVMTASILGPLSALLAAWAYTRQRTWIAAALLIVAAATPTYAAWPLAVVPIGIAIWIVMTRSRNEP